MLRRTHALLVLFVLLTTTPATADSCRAEAYGRRRLVFEANHGQTDPRVAFVARARGRALFLARDEVVLTLDRPGTCPAAPAVLRMRLVGASPTPAVVGRDALPGIVNDLRGRDQARWHTRIPTFASVEYEGVYPGVSLVFHGGEPDLEYDLVVAPGADPRRIEIAFDGAQSMGVDEQGDLRLAVGGEVVVEKRPRVYQEVAGRRHDVAAAWDVRGAGRARVRLARYDRRQPLVIDPVLTYSTYLGGSGSEYGLAIAVDSSGSAYVTGYTQSIDYPTRNPYRGALSGTSDAFVAKLNPAGDAFVYSTYLGGSGSDSGDAIAVDAAGYAYIAGDTTSTDFPLVAPFQMALAGLSDAFVAKLSPAGDTLVYSTYLGGSDSDLPTSIAVETNGNACVGGETSSADFPLKSAVQGTYKGLGDAFLTKLVPAGDLLVYSTYLGGSDAEFHTAVALDASGNAYLTGSTRSTDFPTVTPFQAALSVPADAFVAKLAADGSRLVYSTYLGGNQEDTGESIAVDAMGNAYIAGTTSSSDFPTQNPLQTALADPPDAFVTKLDAAGRTLVYSTYLGGTGGGDEEGWRIALDSTGSVYLATWTEALDFPTKDPFQATNAGSMDVVLSKLTPDGSALDYSTYLGGSDWDDVYGLALDPSGAAYLTGGTYSLDFPTARPLQRSFGGGGDAYVAKIEGGTCMRPGAVGNNLALRKEGANLRLTWQDLLGVSPYTIFAGSSKSAPPPNVYDRVPSGSPGSSKARPPDPILFFRVAGENACGLGPL